MFTVIATVSWLSNREIEKSLARARKSEAELKIERDSLEIKVEERTKELKETQAEKMTQLYRFAEFGRLSSGLFHDLVNPLNAVALNMEKVKSIEANGDALSETKTYLKQAVTATKKMEDFVAAVRRQIARQESNTLFSLTDETKQVIDVLAHKALKADVKLVFSFSGDIKIIGDAVKFNQVILNLIANGIDAYSSKEKQGDDARREVKISLTEKDGLIGLTVKDGGEGIPKENFDRIFEPFFTTKNGNGMGIGLSMAKRIVEKDFGGSIKVQSEQDNGAIFTIIIPNNKYENRS